MLTYALQLIGLIALIFIFFKLIKKFSYFVLVPATILLFAVLLLKGFISLSVFIWIAAVLIILSFIFIIFGFKYTDKTGEVHVEITKTKKEIALEELSKIWRMECFENQEAKEKYKEELIQEIKKETINDKTESSIFKNERLQSFYNKHIKNNKSMEPLPKNVIIGIMKLLEEKGSCPSVVQNPKNENDYDATRLAHQKNEYGLLSQVTLLEHSLNVAEELLRLHDFSYLTMPRDIIAALGHDLGKIPEYHVGVYATGDHPDISLYVLSQIEGYKEIQCRKEVEDAITKHHLAPKEPFSKDLIKADHTARQEELKALKEKQMAEQLKANQDAESKKQEANQPPQQQIEQKSNQEIEQNAESQIEQQEPNKAAATENEKQSDDNGAQSDDIINSTETDDDIPDLDRIIKQAKHEKALKGDETKKDKIDDSEIDLEWLSIEKMLLIIKDQYLNKMIDGKFSAFSTKNGYVFVQSGKIMDTFARMAKEEGRLQYYDIDDKKERKAIQLKIINIMRERGYIAEELVQKGYFGGYFIIKFKQGTLPHKEDKLRGFFVPFYSKAFSSDIASLEAIKQGLLKKIESVEIDKEKETD